MIYIGVDPGKSGAYAIIYPPFTEAKPLDEDKFIKDMVDLLSAEEGVVCALEKVGAMPGQGVTSMFSFGENFGFIQGVLRALAIPFEMVTPRKWKAEFGLNSEKERSITVCQRLFPEVSLLRTPHCRKLHDGMAEAVLLAEWARRHIGRE